MKDELRSSCYVAIDFDGACVSHSYPEIGQDIGADPWLRAAQALGAKLILWTMRDHDTITKDGNTALNGALEWMDGHGIRPWSVNDNPEQDKWSSSERIYANIYVSTATIGCPVKRKEQRGRYFVDWEIAGPLLLGRVAGILNQ